MKYPEHQQRNDELEIFGGEFTCARAGIDLLYLVKNM